MTSHYVAFTGTQRGANPAQLRTLIQLLAGQPRDRDRVFRHGAANGADEQAHYMAFAHGWTIEAFPCNMPSKSSIKRIRSTCSIPHDPGHPLDRHKTMVDGADLVIGIVTADWPERYGTGGPLKGGTWSTIEHALQATIRTAVIFPDGDVYYPPVGQLYTPRQGLPA